MSFRSRIDGIRADLRRYGLRYLLIGVWNTCFGVGVYTLLLIYFGQKHYLLLGIISNVLAVTNAFLGHKHFVFRTRGNWLSEYLRCYVVYAGSILFGMAGMVLCVEICRWDAVWSNFGVTAVNFILSFFGHRYFSFRPGRSEHGPEFETEHSARTCHRKR